jgi:hypothetical protein
MIKKIYIIFMVLFVIGGLVFLIQMGLKEKPLAKIKWSGFNSEAEVARAISLRLRQEIKDHSIVFLGVEPGNKNHLNIWKEWLILNSEPEWQFDEVLFEPGLKFAGETWPAAKALDIRKDQEFFVQMIRDPKNAKRRIAVILPHVYSSQLIVDNPVKRVIKESRVKILSITLLEMEHTNLPCVAEGVDYTGQSILGCKVKEKLFFVKNNNSRWGTQPPPYYKDPTADFDNKKTKDESIWSGTLEQYGISDFLMFMKNS